ncbi:serine/threonine-protein kinase Sgk2 [Metarhizium brunneum]
MIDQHRSDVIKTNPIGNGLEIFRSSFHAKYELSSKALDRLALEGTSPTVLQYVAIDLTVNKELQNLSVDLLLALQTTRACRLLRSSGNGKNLLGDLLRLNSAVNSGDFDIGHIKPLLEAALADSLDDALVWSHVYDLVTESTPPLRPISSFIEQTPWSQNTSSFVNSSELRTDVDKVLKQELGPLYVGIPNLHDTIFEGIPGLGTASKTAFGECIKGDNPLFNEGWAGWPRSAKESDVVAWLVDLIPKLEAFAGGLNSTLPHRRKLLAQPSTPLLGSTGKRSLDIGFVNNDITYNPDAKDSRYRWSHVLVAGELKKNPKADTASIAWIDLARYAREVLAAQDTRRFVLGFTLCGSLMRVWEFDRLGGIGSEQFDINKNGQMFVTTVLGFLRMDEEKIGVDPTIVVSGSERYIEIERNGKRERLIIDEVMKRAPCVAGRATTCWRAHRKDDPKQPLVIKDSWQYTDRDEEGELLQEATDKDVINVARYYHHETVRIRGIDDDILNNVRRGLDVTKAANYRPTRSNLSLATSRSSVSRTGRSSSVSLKRPSSETDTAVPPSKRSCSRSPTKHNIESPANRVHRRTIVCDYGKPIYMATSRASLLACLAGCLEGHESLHNAGLLHRDISINNLMINEEEKNPSYSAFLIDLDLAVREQRVVASGAKGKTGTRAFMAIGTLLGEQHSFMHDVESFFWVLFWICIHFDGQNERVVKRFERWNYADTEELASSKKGVISDEEDFLQIAQENFTPYYKPLIAMVNRLRRKVFPSGERWKRPNLDLYGWMKSILVEAQKDQA